MDWVRKFFQKSDGLRQAIGYTYQVFDDNSFTVYRAGKEIFTSHKYRLRIQAEVKAKLWIKRQTIADYKYKINPDKSFTVYHQGKELYTSRAYRLEVQADRKAKDYIKNLLGIEDEGDVTLDVQNLSVDASTFFGARKNG